MTKETPEWLVYDETTGTATITMSRPFSVDGSPRADLTMREPTVQDQLTMSHQGGSDAQQELRLLSNLLEITEADLKRMPVRDYKRVARAYVGFTD